MSELIVSSRGLHGLRGFRRLPQFILGTLLLAGCAGEKSPPQNVASEEPAPGTEFDHPDAASPGKPVVAIARDFESRQRKQRVSVPSERDVAAIISKSGDTSESRTSFELPEAADLHNESTDSPEIDRLLEIGDKAPEVSGIKWLHGNPVSVADSSTILVLEFWETDCGPCLEVIPEVCALQSEYGDRVTFARISPEEESVVTEFLSEVSSDGQRKWSEILNVAVGIDPRRQSWTAYLYATEHQGIPCTVVIGRDKKVEWIGHPDELKGPLKQIVDGTWNTAEARKLAADNRAAQMARRELSPEIRTAIDAREYTRAVTLIDEFLERFPNDEDLEFLRLKCLIQGEMFEPANASAEKMIAAAMEDAPQLDKLAWIIATTSESPEINLDLALSAAERAAALTNHSNCSVMETLARVHFRRGRIAEAIQLQEQAIQLAANPESAKPLQAALEEYRNKLGENPEMPF